MPGDTWHGGSISSATYTGSNQLALAGNNSALTIATSSASYTPPSVLTVSAAMAVNDINSNGDPFGRGMGLGFFSSVFSSGVSEVIWTGGLTLDAAAGSATDGSGPGAVELDMGTGTKETRPVIIPFPAALGTFSSSTLYTLSYTIDTSTGQISNVSLSDGTTIDTADYQQIDDFDTTGVFTAANTAYVGILNTAANVGTGSVSDFQLSGAGSSVPTGSVWTGLADTTWANPGNWTGNVPGSTTGTTSTDTAVFNQAATNSPTTIDAGRNVMNIVFDTAAVSSMTIGTTTGPALILTSGGTIQATSTVTNPQTINAPLVLEGSYTFTSDSTASSATLTFGGGIAPDPANSGLTTLTLNGANTGANTIAGVLRDNGSAKLAVSKSDGGTWRLTGTNTFTGGIGVSGGTLRLAATTGTPTIGGGAAVSGSGTLELAGSVSQLNQTVNIANSSSATAGLLVSSSTAQKVGTILGTGNVVVNTGASLTAYQIRQNSLTITGTGKVTLSPSGSGSTSTPAAPNNINFSSNVNSLTLGGTTDAWTGTLDIGNNALVIQYGAGTDPYTTIVNMVKSAYGTGTWNGTATGITSSLAAAAANSSAPLNIGLRDFKPGQNGDPTSLQFAGQTITTSAVLVRLTYMDDLILAGDMQQGNATSDALRFAANYGTGTTWSVGDLNHDGVINTGDALIFAANYVTGLPSLDGTTGNAAALGSGAAAVPEPSSLLLAAIGVLGLNLLAKRRRRPRC